MFHVKQSENYTLVRSDRKSVSLEITEDGSLLVRAPRWFSGRDAATFVEKNTAWIEKHRPAVVQKNAVFSSLQKDEEKQLRRDARRILSKLTDKYARKMQLYPSRITITGAKKRFGSCSAKNAVAYSFRLLFYPPEAVEYVVVHELAHIRHHDHSRAFHALVAETLPDAEEREKLLKPEYASSENDLKNLRTEF